MNVDNTDGRLKPQMFVRAIVRAKLAEDGLIVNAALAGKWICPMHPEVLEDELGDCRICEMSLVRAESLGFVSLDDVDERPPLVVPASAVLMTGKRAVVYVAVPDKPGTYEGRVVVPGTRAGDYYLVRDGLTEGEQVVVNGNFKIDSAIQIRARPSMMTLDDEDAEPASGHEHHKAQDKAESFDVPAEFTAKLKPLFETYFGIQTALSLDSADDAKKAANGFCKAIEAVDMSLLEGAAHQAWMKERKEITKIARRFIAADGIQKARSVFDTLSGSMIGVAKRFGAGGADVYLFHCPMAFNDRGADWLQNHQKTNNPYFGSAMFRCGFLKETFAGAPDDAPTRSDEDSTGGEGGH